MPFELEHGAGVGSGEARVYVVGGKSSGGKQNKDYILRLKKNKLETLLTPLEVA